jgi:hypothetical protein
MNGSYALNVTNIFLCAFICVTHVRTEINVLTHTQICVKYKTQQKIYQCGRGFIYKIYAIYLQRFDVCVNVFCV